MNRKQLILLLFVLLVIGGAGLILINQHKESWSVHEARMGDKVFSDFRPNDVAVIHVKGESELTVLRTNDFWGVKERQNYPANFGQISDLLIKLRDLKVVQAETVGIADLGRVKLDPAGKGSESGTEVEFRDAQGKVLQSILLGKKHMRAMNDSAHSQFVGTEPDGRYILLSNEPQEVLLVSNTLAVLDPHPEAWLNRDFIKIERIKSIAYTSTNPADSWKVSRETEASAWVLADAKPGEDLDSTKISAIGNMLSAPRFVDIAPPSAPSQLGLDYPKVVTIETFDGLNYTLKIGGKAADDSYYVTVVAAGDLPKERVSAKDEKTEDKAKLDKEFTEDSKKLADKLKQEKNLSSWVYLMNTWLIDPAIHDRAHILQGAHEERVVNSEPVAAPAPRVNNSLPGAPGWTPRVIK